MARRQILLLLFVFALSQTPIAKGQIDTTPTGTTPFSLQDILTLALERNPLVAEGHGIVDQKEGDALAASAYPNPTISVQGGRGSVRDPSTSTSITERYITLSQPLEWPGKRSAQQQAARAGAEGAQAGLEEAKLNVMAEVKKGFFNLLLLKQEADLALQNVQTIEKLSKAVNARVQAGEAPPFEAVKVKVEGLKFQKELARTKGTIRSAKAALNGLTANALGENFTIRGNFQSMSEDLDIPILSEKALSNHPSMVRARKLVEEAQKRHRRERQARIPNITLNGSYQRDVGREAFVGGFSIPLPLWNQRQGEIAKAKGILRQQEAFLLRTTNRLHKGITQQVQHSKIAAAQIATYEEGLLKQAHEALRIAQVSFRVGEASLLEVLDAQRVFRETQFEYTRAKYDLSVALTELEQLTGGM